MGFNEPVFARSMRLFVEIVVENSRDVSREFRKQGSMTLRKSGSCSKDQYKNPIVDVLKH